ncbi:flagellar filament capping protein FliD [Bacillus sp. ISL-41]|nr:flagellar filament capping protein FliD [Bacillus sp. ISL-41]
MRIGGLASGMDIDQIVGDLMKAERMPLDKLKQQKQVLEWQRDDYRSMNSLLLGFRTELTNMKLTTQYRARSVTSTNSNMISATASSAASQASYTIKSVTSMASAATKVSSGISTDALNKVDASKSLYSQQSKMSGGSEFQWTDGAIGSRTVKADGVLSQFPGNLNDGEKIKLSSLSEMSVKVNGKNYTLVEDVAGVVLEANQVAVDENGQLRFSGPLAKDSTIKFDYILNEKIETKKFSSGTSAWEIGSPISNVTLEVDGITYKLSPDQPDSAGFKALVADDGSSIGRVNLETGKTEFVPALATEKEIKVTYTPKYASFSLTSETSKGRLSENFLISTTDSLNQVVNKVNSSNVGVTMFYDQYADKLSLTRTETGDFNDGRLSGGGVPAVNQIKATGLFATELLQLSAGDSNGTNAVFEINGMQTSRSSNTFEMNGVTFTLRNKFADTDPAVSLSVNNDSNKVFDNIKAFVDKYNELIDKIQKKTSEEYYRSYKPLTDEQRESLSDKQQEQWEEKAKSGLLKRDPILTGVLNGMRSNFYAPVKSAAVNPLMNQLASIGIKTTANYMQGGKLEINEAELKKAIENDPASVENLFRGTGTTSDEQGIVHRLYDTVNGAMDKLKERAGNSFSTTKQFLLGRQLDNVDRQIDRFEDRMIKVEDRYWRQFTAMEKAIQRSNSQSMYLMQQFSM